MGFWVRVRVGVGVSVRVRVIVWIGLASRRFVFLAQLNSEL